MPADRTEKSGRTDLLTSGYRSHSYPTSSGAAAWNKRPKEIGPRN